MLLLALMARTHTHTDMGEYFVEFASSSSSFLFYNYRKEKLFKLALKINANFMPKDWSQRTSMQ